MTKELEALHTIAFNTQINGLNFGDELRIIEQALQRLEAIDNTKPSEALERTSSEIIDGYPTGNVNVGMTWEEHSAIKQTLQKSQEQEKVLEIIFEKEVNMQVFNQCEDVETYNKVYIKQKDRQLTQEEFDKVKRCLTYVSEN